MAELDALLENNAKVGSPLAPGTQPKLCVVACDDARLTGQLEDAVGFEAAKTVLVRLPGAGGALPEEWVQRALVKAVFVEGCREVVFLSHSDCTLETVSANAIVDAMQKRGVSRTALPWDVREAVGAGRSARVGLRELVERLRRCAFLPEDLPVHLAHLDESTGKISLVDRGEPGARTRPAESAGLSGYRPGPVDPQDAALPSVPAAPMPTLVPPELPAEPQGPIALDAGLPPESPRIAVEMPRVTLPQATVSGAKDARPAPRLPKAPPMPKVLAEAIPVRKELEDALATVRLFLMAELKRSERQLALEHIESLGKTAAAPGAMVKALVDPIMQLGEARYRVIDELVLIKDDLSRMGTEQALQLLRRVLR